MRNLSELNANELTRCLCALAGPAEKIFSDGAVTHAMDSYKKKIDENTRIDKGFSLFVTMVFSDLMEKHGDDVYAIIAALDDAKVEDVKARNGVEVMRDIFKAFVLDGDLSAIFRPGCEAGGE